MSGAGETAPEFPGAVADLVASIDRGDVLGASRQLAVLGDCLVGLAQVQGADAQRLRADVQVLVEHIERTRGGSSKAVTNGMSLMTDGLLHGGPEGDARDPAARLRADVGRFRDDLAEWLRAVRRHGADLLSSADVVLAYDYSSTVAQVMCDVAAARSGIRVLVPEARSLDGGVKYLDDWRSVGLTVHLVPDSAVSWALGECDVVLAGAETLSAEGGCYNTIGTAPTAAEAARAGIPVQVLSVLLKTDLDAAGASRSSPTLDFVARLGVRGRVGDGDPLQLRGDFPDLDYTPPSDVTSVVTEVGVLTPDAVEAAARRVLGGGGR